jgi:hypothetical protein
MYVSDRIVFVELQKTGCTHIRNLLKELLGGRFVERHIQADPSLFVEGRSFFGSVRDPWPWYMSLWAYGCDGKGDIYDNVTTPGIRLRKRGWRLHPIELLGEVMQSRLNRHAREWRRTMLDVNDAGAFRQWLYMLNDEAYWGDVGEGYWRFPLTRFAGLMTYRYMKLFACKKGENDRMQAITTPEQLVAFERAHCFIDHVIRNERLEADLLAALQDVGIAVPPETIAAWRNRPRTNTSSKKHGPGYYYDADTEKLVGEREKLIIEKFGYRAPSEREALAQLPAAAVAAIDEGRRAAPAREPAPVDAWHDDPDVSGALQ